MGRTVKLREGNGWKKWDDEPNLYIENWLEITISIHPKKMVGLGVPGFKGL